MRLAFRRSPYDLYVTAGASLAILPAIAFPVPDLLRLALGLLFVLFLPGYAMEAALFPRKADTDWIERVAMSFGLSIAILPLLGLALNSSPWGVRIESIVAATIAFTLGVSALAYWRRMRLPEGDRLGMQLELVRPTWRTLATTDRALAVALAVSLVLAAVAFALASPRPADRYTEFYLLDASGGVDAYPTHLNVSEWAGVVVGIANHELRPMDYTVSVRLVTLETVYNMTTGKNETIERSNVTLDVLSESLADGARKEIAYGFQIANTGDYRLRFLLFAGSPTGVAYRSPSLRILVA